MVFVQNKGYLWLYCNNKNVMKGDRDTESSVVGRQAKWPDVVFSRVTAKSLQNWDRKLVMLVVTPEVATLDVIILLCIDITDI